MQEINKSNNKNFESDNFKMESGAFDPDHVGEIVKFLEDTKLFGTAGRFYSYCYDYDDDQNEWSIRSNFSILTSNNKRVFEAINNKITRLNETAETKYNNLNKRFNSLKDVELYDSYGEKIQYNIKNLISLQKDLNEISKQFTQLIEALKTAEYYTKLVYCGNEPQNATKESGHIKEVKDGFIEYKESILEMLSKLKYFTAPKESNLILSKFPNEIWLQILSKLGKKDLFSVKQSCKGLSPLSDEAILECVKNTVKLSFKEFIGFLNDNSESNNSESENDFSEIMKKISRKLEKIDYLLDNAKSENDPFAKETKELLMQLKSAENQTDIKKSMLRFKLIILHFLSHRPSFSLDKLKSRFIDESDKSIPEGLPKRPWIHHPSLFSLAKINDQELSFEDVWKILISSCALDEDKDLNDEFFVYKLKLINIIGSEKLGQEKLQTFFFDSVRDKDTKKMKLILNSSNYFDQISILRVITKLVDQIDTGSFFKILKVFNSSPIASRHTKEPVSSFLKELGNDLCNSEEKIDLARRAISYVQSNSEKGELILQLARCSQSKTALTDLLGIIEDTINEDKQAKSEVLSSMIEHLMLTDGEIDYDMLGKVLEKIDTPIDQAKAIMNAIDKSNSHDFNQGLEIIKNKIAIERKDALVAEYNKLITEEKKRNPNAELSAQVASAVNSIEQNVEGIQRVLNQLEEQGCNQNGNTGDDAH